MRRQIILLSVTVVLIVTAFVWALLSGDRPGLGLDLQGGVSVVLQPVKGSDLSTLDTAAQIIRNRVDALGIAEPDVSRQGNSIVVDLPGAKNQQDAIRLVGETAELRFREVLGTVCYWSDAVASAGCARGSASGVTTTTVNGATSTTAKGASTTTAPHGSTTTTSGSTATTKKSLATRSPRMQAIAARRPAAAPSSTAPATTAPSTGTTAKPTTGSTAKGATTPTTAPGPGAGTCKDGALVTPPEKNTKSAQQVILPDQQKIYCYLLGPTLTTGRSISTAKNIIDPSTASWVVDVTFKNNDFLDNVAKPKVGKQVAITLDQEVVSAPTIEPNITGRDVQITGSFGEHTSHQLALALRYGSLPVIFSPATSQTVSPTLGKDQLHAGLIAGLIGLALVALYMILFYRLLGLVVWVGIGLTGMTFYALVTYLSATRGLTLTLAGVTGIIVSVGVTVDSYVVYFERLKDEVRTGKTIRSSLDPGFRRAFRTIIAADLVSLIGAAVLYVLAAGSVRGFAYFLGLSTLLDLLLAYCFMHPCVTLLARRTELVRMPGVGIAAGLDVPGVRA